MPPPPIPPWIIFAPAILIAGIFATVIAVSYLANRAGRPVARIRPSRPAFRPTIIQGGKPDAPAVSTSESEKRAG